jgi:hypothetical protein
VKIATGGEKVFEKEGEFWMNNGRWMEAANDRSKCRLRVFPLAFYAGCGEHLALEIVV